MNSADPPLDRNVKPLKSLVDLYLSIHRRISLRPILFGVDPDHTPNFIITHENRWFNRDCLVDVYAIVWPIAGLVLLYFGSNPSIHFGWALFILVVAAYRLNELFGAVFYILVYRAREDTADGRKLAISLLAYLEPIILFAILHSVFSAILAAGKVTESGAGYNLNGQVWGAITAFHFSVECYTTVGWGDVSATNPCTMILSDIEAITGIIMLTLTVSRFVSAVLGPSTASPASDIPPAAATVSRQLP